MQKNILNLLTENARISCEEIALRLKKPPSSWAAWKLTKHTFLWIWTVEMFVSPEKKSWNMDLPWRCRKHIWRRSSTIHLLWSKRNYKKDPAICRVLLELCLLSADGGS